jgi:hypothetical protein
MVTKEIVQATGQADELAHSKMLVAIRDRNIAIGMSGRSKNLKGASSGVVFPGVQKSTGTHDEVAKAYYFHCFYDFQPDLNTSNPKVQAEILKIMVFWLQLGVSGSAWMQFHSS